MEHPWLLTSKIRRGPKAKNVCFISTSTAAEKSRILADLKSLMTSDLNFTRNREETEKPQQVREGSSSSQKRS